MRPKVSRTIQGTSCGSAARARRLRRCRVIKARTTTSPCSYEHRCRPNVGSLLRSGSLSCIDLRACPTELSEKDKPGFLDKLKESRSSVRRPKRFRQPRTGGHCRRRQRSLRLRRDHLPGKGEARGGPLAATAADPSTRRRVDGTDLAGRRRELGGGEPVVRTASPTSVDDPSTSMDGGPVSGRSLKDKRTNVRQRTGREPVHGGRSPIPGRTTGTRHSEPY